jgi:hypothetical protein
MICYPPVTLWRLHGGNLIDVFLEGAKGGLTHIKRAPRLWKEM